MSIFDDKLDIIEKEGKDPPSNIFCGCHSLNIKKFT